MIKLFTIALVNRVYKVIPKEDHGDINHLRIKKWPPPHDKRQHQIQNRLHQLGQTLGGAINVLVAVLQQHSIARIALRHHVCSALTLHNLTFLMIKVDTERHEMMK